MSYTALNPRQLTLLDVTSQTTDRAISSLIRKFVPDSHWTIQRGDQYQSDGECCQRIYITLAQPEHVDEFMKHQSFQLTDRPLRVIRSLPKWQPLYDRPVTGLKIKINMNDKSTGRLTESNLIKHFASGGETPEFKWTNADRTEALFTYSYYDMVDKIILTNPSVEIKGVKIHLEKTWTAKDYVAYDRLYVVHVTNLPVCITSEEISKIFDVPITRIRLYPCFRLEQAHDVNGRKSSEAWITDFNDEKDRAEIFAKKNTGTFVSQQRIFCEAMLAVVNTEELCEHFQKGHCAHMNRCHCKHIYCSDPDGCEDQFCWLGHSEARITKSVERPEFRSEDASYRMRLTNLPWDITRQKLSSRLRLDAAASKFLVLQPKEQNSKSPRMAYLIRQPLENRLRHQIDKWHNTSFSQHSPQTIQCQLEINQDLFEWNDIADRPQSNTSSRRTSPTGSRRSTFSNVFQTRPGHSSAISTFSCKETTSKSSRTVKDSRSFRPVLTTQLSTSKNKPPTNFLRQISDQGTCPQPPAGFSNFPKRWRWTNRTVLKHQSNRDELYLIESELLKEKNLVAKIYLPKNDSKTLARAQREKLALERLKQLSCVPKLLESNVDSKSDAPTSDELLTVMKRIGGEKLSTYVQSNKSELRGALKLTRQLLSIIQQIHNANVIHRDIQPENILVRHRPNTDEIYLTLIDFSSAWISDLEEANSELNYDTQLADVFYRMPQFELQQDQENEQVKKAQRSPTVDASGIGAILFWLITGHKPKESRNISGEAPHQLQVHSKLIERKIMDATAFRTGVKVHEHLKRHLTQIFDHSFAAPDQQWSVAELDYQLQLIVELIANENEQINYFPVPSSTSTDMLSPSIPLEDLFVYGVSIIHNLKKRFQTRYINGIRWSTEEKSNWCSQNGRIENYDSLIFHCQGKDFPINIKWDVSILGKNQQLLVHLKARTNNNIIISLPLGVWMMTDQTVDFETHLKNFEIEIKILINILFKSVAQ